MKPYNVNDYDLDDITTIYFGPESFSYESICKLEDYLGIEISLGSVSDAEYVNLYTADNHIVKLAIQWLRKHRYRIVEVPRFPELLKRGGK